LVGSLSRAFFSKPSQFPYRRRPIRVPSPLRSCSWPLLPPHSIRSLPLSSPPFFFGAIREPSRFFFGTRIWRQPLPSPMVVMLDKVSCAGFSRTGPLPALFEVFFFKTVLLEAGNLVLLSSLFILFCFCFFDISGMHQVVLGTRLPFRRRARTNFAFF